MYGNWKINKNLVGKWLEVECDNCGYVVQKLPSQIKRRHQCPSIIDGTKYCYKCQTRKPLDVFWKDSTVNNGYSKLCKDCWAVKSNIKRPKGNPIKRRTHKQYNWNGKRATKNGTIEHFLQQRQNTLKYRNVGDGVPRYNLPDGYLYELFCKQNGKCFYTGLPLDHTIKGRFSSNSISVDRLVPNKGYTVDNIALCLNAVNSMKNDMNVEEFRQFISTVIAGLNTFVGS